ncbi:MAG: MBL fold metallo-hydrolase [Bacteroidales bacterium]|jgi:hydroxyacylglutathione hydrolase|nr:MBL fold metallo-hydrolase [Bacteroidales bacterium]
MHIQTFQFNHFYQNTYVITDSDTRQSAIIDPGCFFEAEKQKLISFITDNNYTLNTILYTHCHLDHVFGAACIYEKFPNIPIYGHKDENPFIDNAISQSIRYGISMDQPPSITNYISEGSAIQLGNSTLYAIHVPGHSKGSICYYYPQDNILFSGDALFAGSIGRSDLPGGNHETLIENISTKLLPLPGETIVYPGHGEPTTIQIEKESNPFLQE